jgi:nitric oxide dioxygenase
MEHGESLTRHFYQRMFDEDPGVKAFFNPAHQHSGTQQRALAAAICAYAQHIENPGELASAVALIAHKHASLQILPAHYPIVGKHLLASIREVLGEAATDDVINAWAEAYGVLAGLFVQKEEGIYEGHRELHGWSGFRPFVIKKRVQESATITSFHLSPRDGGGLSAFQPGQYLTVRVPTMDGSTTMRNYSLSNSSGEGHYRISVKREPATIADAPDGFVSNYLHHTVEEGGILEVGPPCGVFTLDVNSTTERPLVLLSGGVGITPTLAMLRAAIVHQPTRPIHFLHGALNSQTHAFRDEVTELAAAHQQLRVHVRYSNPLETDLSSGRCHSTGFFDANLIRNEVRTPEADFYYCGPKPFMKAVHQALGSWGVAPDSCHFEFFGPAEAMA